MTRVAAQKPAAVKLPIEKVVAWRLDRQRLAGTRATDPAAVARDLVGVQAQVLTSAALAVAIRSEGSVEATGVALSERRLVRSWAMRGTLHLFAAEDLPLVVAAVGRVERWHRPAWLRWFGVTESEMEAAIEMVGEILDDGRPRTRSELNEDLLARLGPRFGSLMRGSWGSFLNLATNRGYLCHAVSADGAVRFVRPRRWLGTWQDMDGDAALGTLIGRYLAAYGPASQREITRWWGVANQRDLAPILARIGDGLTEVEVDGDRGFVRTIDLAEIEAAKLRRGDAGVHLLGPFDPLIVGAGMRNHLLPAAHIKRVSRTAGWISPVLLVDGRAAGVWDSRRSGRRLTITVEPFRALGKTVHSALHLAAERVAAAQGATVKVEFGPVFAEKGAPLVIPRPVGDSGS